MYVIKPKTVASVSIASDFTVEPDLYNLIINNAVSAINVTIPDLYTFTDKTELTFINNSTFPMNIVTNNQVLTTMAPSTTQIYVIFDQALYNIFNVASTSNGGVFTKDGSSAMAGDLNMASYKMINVGSPTAPQDIVTKGYVDTQLSAGGLHLKTDGSSAMTAPLNMGGNKIINVTNPFNAQDAVTKAYIDGNVSTNVANLNSTFVRTSMSAPLNMGGNKMVGVADPTLAQDVATKNYVDVNTETSLIKLNGANAMTAPLNLSAKRIVNAANPSAAHHASTKKYVDDLLTGEYVAKNGSVAMMGALNMGDHKITNVAAPVDPTDGVPKNYVPTVSTTVSTTGPRNSHHSIFDLKWDYFTLPSSAANTIYTSFNGFSFRGNFTSVNKLPHVWSTQFYKPCDATYTGNTITIDIETPRVMGVWCVCINIDPAFDTATGLTLSGGDAFGVCPNAIITSNTTINSYTECAAPNNMALYRYYTLTITANRNLGKMVIKTFELLGKTFT